MAALTEERNTPARTGDTLALAVAAAVICFAGALAARDGSGNATPGDTATTLRGLGRFKKTYNNAAGLAGDVIAEIEKGIFRFANSAAADEISAADIGNDCYIVDDQTVAGTNGGSTRSVAGKVFDVDSQGVWVDFR